MIITNVDGRSMTVVIDLLQAKMMVELIRQTTPLQYEAAATAVSKSGYVVTLADVQSVVGSMHTVLGYTTDSLRKQPEAETEQPDKAEDSKPPYTVH